MTPAERQKPVVTVTAVPAEACGRTVTSYRWIGPNGAIEIAWSRAEAERRIGAHTDVKFSDLPEAPSRGLPPSTPAGGASRRSDA